MSGASAERVRWVVDLEGIDRARIRRGWTRDRLAKTARVNAGTLSAMFAGRRRPTFGTLSALCAALALELGDVIDFPPAVGSGGE
jgi:DNA-binding Xre family transcriptional regulator